MLAGGDGPVGLSDSERSASHALYALMTWTLSSSGNSCCISEVAALQPDWEGKSTFILVSEVMLTTVPTSPCFTLPQPYWGLLQLRLTEHLSPGEKVVAVAFFSTLMALERWEPARLLAILGIATMVSHSDKAGLGMPRGREAEDTSSSSEEANSSSSSECAKKDPMSQDLGPLLALLALLLLEADDLVPPLTMTARVAGLDTSVSPASATLRVASAFMARSNCQRVTARPRFRPASASSVLLTEPMPEAETSRSCCCRASAREASVMTVGREATSRSPSDPSLRAFWSLCRRAPAALMGPGPQISRRATRAYSGGA